MIVTPETAQTMVCCGQPIMLVLNAVAGGKDEGETFDVPKCVGDACMAWRWYDAKLAEGWCGLAGSVFTFCGAAPQKYKPKGKPK
jgi:hypothetical protein